MAEVPIEAAEFARLLVRAFYTPDFVVVMDSILRQNNYVSHHELARRLTMQPKELRQVLVRMEGARLMRSERRQQKRINYRDERRPTRTVNTEFWYVPLGELVDAFLYRVHVLSKAIEEKRNNETKSQKHMCTVCKTQYELLEILSSMNERDEFICMRMGVRLDRRQLPCGGIIQPQDNSAEIKETERVKQLLDEELRELLQRAQICATLDIPVHPLEGADEKTWGERVPEAIGLDGEPVDEEGLSAALKGETDDMKSDRAEADLVPTAASPAEKDDGTIPEKPSWFKESKADDDLDWETTGQVLENKTGTSAVFAQREEDNSYYEQYMRTIAGVQAEKPPLPTAGDVIDLDGDEKEETRESSPEVVAEPGKNANVIVSVGGKNMKMSEVTPAMIENMSAEEYGKYFDLQQKSSGNEDNVEEELEDDDFE